MSKEEPTRKILEELKRRFRAAGKGSVSRVQEELNLGSGYFRDQRRSDRQRYDLRVLFATLEALEVDAAEFFASVFGYPDPAEAFKAEAVLLRRRVRRLPRILVLESERRRRSRKTATAADLSALAGRWHEDPKGVMRSATSLISRVEDSQVPVVLGIYGSAARIAGRLNEAHLVIARALELAQERAEPAIVGNLLQRSSYVVGERGSFQSAYALCERSASSCVRGGDLAGVGKALTAQGTWLACLGRYHESIQACEAAARYFPREGEGSETRRYRVSCLMSIGVTYRVLGGLEKAQHYAELARQDADGIPKGLLGKLIGLQASIAEQLGLMELAEDHFREAVDAYRDISPLDTVLATMDLVRVQLRQGRGSEVYETAKSMLPLLHLIEPNSLASAAVTEVLRRAVAGRGLSLELLGRASRAIRNWRAQPQGRARQSYPES